MVNSIRDNIMEIRAQIAAAAEKSGRGMDGGDYSLRGCTLMASSIMVL